MDVPLDTTQINTFLACPERFRLRFHERLQKIQEDQYEQPRKFGEAIHRALEAFYRGQSSQAANDVFLALFPTALTDQELVYTPQNGLIVLRNYIEWATVNSRDLKVLAVEEPIVLDLAPGVPFAVKPDRVILSEQTGIWSIETKTTSKYVGEDYWRQFELSAQVSAQVYAITQKYGQCSGVVAHAISIGYRKRTYKGEPPGFHVRVEPQIFNRTQAQLDRWKRTTLMTIDRLRRCGETQGPWEQHFEACFYCSFSQFCQACGDEQVRDTLFERVGNPYDYLTRTLGATMEPGGKSDG